MAAVQTMQHYTFEWANLLSEINYLEDLFKTNLNSDQTAYISGFVCNKHEALEDLADHIITSNGNKFYDEVLCASSKIKLSPSVEFVEHVQNYLATMLKPECMEDLKLPTRTIQLLKRAGVDLIKLLSMTKSELLQVRNLNAIHVKEIEQKLNVFGLKLASK